MKQVIKSNEQELGQSKAKFGSSNQNAEQIDIMNRQKTMRTNNQPSGQLFPKRGPISNPNRTKNIMNKHNVKHHRNSHTKKGIKTTPEPPPWNGQ